MNFDLWLAFLMACIILAVSPGAGAVNTVSIMIKYGLRGSLISNLGLQVGNIFNISVVGAGLGALLVQSEAMFFVIKWVGALYLIYLGVQKFRETPNYCTELDSRHDASIWKVFIQSIFVNVTNPKSIVFLVALLPQFIEPTVPHIRQILILGSTLVIVDMTVMVGYALLASKFSHLIRNRRHVIIQNRIFGCVFIGAGALLVVVTRN